MAHAAQADPLEPPNNDYHLLPVTEKQLRFAQKIAAQSHVKLPNDIRMDRRAMSAWIERHHPRRTPSATRFSNCPSSKQVAFAERIARIKRRDVPQECFRDRGMMSQWIGCNK